MLEFCLSSVEVLSEVSVDNCVTFIDHIKNICYKPNKNQHALD